jgi:trimeric autotransporter adhesin
MIQVLQVAIKNNFINNQKTIFMKKLLFIIAMLFVLPQAYSANNSVTTPLLSGSVLPVTGTYMNGNTFSITYRGTMELVDFHKNRFEVLYDDAIFELVNPNILTSTGIFMTPTIITGGKRYETPVYSFANAYFGVTEFTLSFRVITTSCTVPPQFIKVTLGTLNPSTGVVSELGTKNLTININNTNAPPTLDAPVLIRGSVCSGSAIYRIRTMGRTDVTNWISMSLPPGVNIQAVYNSSGTQVLPLNVYPYNSGWNTPGCTPAPGSPDAPDRIAWWNRESSPDVQYHYVLVNFTGAGPCSGRLCTSFHDNLYCTTTAVTVGQKISYNRCICPGSTNTGDLPISGTDSLNLGRLIITKTFETSYPLQYFCAPNNCKEHKYVITVDNISNIDVNNVKVEDFLDALNASAGPSAIIVTAIDVSLSNIIPGPSVPFNLIAPTVAGVAPISPSIIYSDGIIHPVYSSTHISTGIWPPISNPTWGIGLGGGSTLPKHTSLKITIWHKLNTCPSSFTDPLVNHMTNTAKLTADNTSGIANDVTIYRSDTVDDAYRPVIAVEKVVRSVVAGPAFNSVVHAAPGEEVEFKVTIRNLGMAPGNVNINDVLSATCPSDLIPSGGFTVIDNTRDGTGTLVPVYSSGDISTILSSIGTPAITGWASSAPVTIQASSSCDAVSTLVITYRATIPVDPCCELQYNNVITLTDPTTSLVVDQIRTATVVVDRFKYIELKLEATCDSSDAASWRNTTINATPGQRIYYRAAVRNNNNINLTDIKMMVQLSGISGPNSTIHNSVPAITLSSFNSLSGTGIPGPLSSLAATGMPTPVSSLFLYDDWLSTNPTTTSPVTGNAIYADGVALTGSPSPGVPGEEYILNYYIDAPTQPTGNVYNTAMGLGLASGTLCPFVVSTDLLLIIADSSSCDSVSADTCVCTITGDSAICAGESTTYTSSCTGGIWSSSIPACVTINPVTGVAAGGSAPCVSVISYSLPSGCVATYTVTVNPSPAPITGETTICAGATTTLSDLTPGGFWSSSASCASVSMAGIVTGVTAPCTAVISYTLMSGCYSVVTVNVGLCDSCCGDSLIISTGYNPLTGTMIAPGTNAGTPVPDPYWIVSTMTPGIFAGIVRPGNIPVIPGFGAGMPSIINNANVLSTTATYSSITNPAGWPSRWISCVNDNRGYTTLLPSSGLTYEMTMTRIFDMCAPDSVLINIGVVADNTILSTDIDGVDLSFTGAGSTTAFTNLTRAVYLGAGRHTLNFVIRNNYASFVFANNTTGINVYGSISSLTGTNSLNTQMDTVCNESPGCACILTGDSVICAGDTMTLSGCDSGLWSSSNPLVASVGLSSGLVTGVSAGTAIITYSSPEGCIAILTLTVNPSPAPITGTTLVCLGSTTTLSDLTPGGFWSSSNIACGTVNATGVVTGITAPCTTVITYMLSSGCYATAVVSINPVPHMCSISVCAICSGELFSYTPSSTTVGATFAWSRPSVPGISNPAATGTDNPNEVLINTTSSPIVVVYVYTITAGGCSSTYNVSVTVYPSPVSTYSVTGGGSYCAGTTCPVIGLSGSTAGITYKLYCGSTYTGVSAMGTGGALSFGPQCGPCVYTVVAEDTAHGCESEMRDSAIVAPYPPCPITGDFTLCVGNVSAYSACPGGTWTSSNPAVASIGMTGVVTANAAGTSTIQFTSINGCITTVVVTVTEFPTVPVITGSLFVCTGGIGTSLTATPAPGTWMLFGATHGTLSPSNPYVGSGVTFNGTSVGVQQIFYMYSNCCGTSLASVTVTVGVMSPVVGPDTVCIGSTIILTDATTGGTWTSSDSTLASVNNSGVVTGHTTGSVVISYLLPSGCIAIKTVYIINCPCSFMCVNGDFETPIGTGSRHIAESTLSPCWQTTEPGNTIELWGSVVTVPAAHGVQFCEINSNVASTTIYTDFTGIPGSTVNIRFAHRGRYTNQDTMAVYIEQSTAGGIFTAPVYPGPPTGATQIGLPRYADNFGGGWNYYSITYTLPNTPGPTRLYFHSVATGIPGVVGGNWLDDVSINLSISPISGPDTICEGTYATEVAGDTCGTWSSSNTAVATVGETTGIIHGESAGAFTLTFTNCNGCITTKVITVSPIPVIVGPFTLCVGSTIDMNEDSAICLTWSSSSTSVATVGSATGVVTGVSSGTSVITVINCSGCYATQTVTVNSSPASCTLSGGGSNCGGVCPEVLLSCSTLGISYQLYNGSTLVGASVPGTGAPLTFGGQCTAGTYTVMATNTTTGCTSVMTGSAVVTACAPCPPCPISGPNVLCAGQSIALSDSCPGGTWSSSDTTNATVDAITGIVSGMSAGTANITYTFSEGCFTVIVVTINATPSTITGTLNVCIGNVTTLSTSPTGGAWTSGNTMRATVGASTGEVTGVSAGTADISYTLAGGCRRKVTVTVVATPSPITGTLTVCSGSTTSLSSATTGGMWSSSDAGIASVDVTTGVVTGVGSSGTSIITYTVGGCFQTVVVTVSAMLGANTGSSLVCVGQNSDLNNATGGGTWSSSNTTIATVHASTGLVTGISAGTATISYRLGGGCFSITVVTVNAALASITGTASVCPGATIMLSNATEGGVWSSSNTPIATVVAGTGLVTGVGAGTATISYLISSGCYQTITVTVNTAPGTIGGAAHMCVGTTVSLSCSPGGGTWSSATPATASITSGGVVTGLMAGTTTISYESGAGCVATLELTVTAATGSIDGTLSACIGATTTLSSTPGGGTWSSSNAARATVGAGTGLVTGVSAGTVIITHAISATCYSTAVVTINATPRIYNGYTYIVCGLQHYPQLSHNRWKLE